MTPTSAMIFAAGRGTRMGHLTAQTPKPLISVSGRPLLDHALALVEDADITNRVVNTHYLGAQIQDHLAERDVTWIHEEVLLETGGGLRNALPVLGDDPVITLNSDAVWTGSNPISTLCRAWDPNRMDALLLLIPRKNAHGYTRDGDFVSAPSGQISRGTGDVYSGAQIIKTRGLGNIDEQAFSLNVLWDDMLANGRAFGVLHDGGWCDVGHPEGIKTAEALLKDHQDV